MTVNLGVALTIVQSNCFSKYFSPADSKIKLELYRGNILFVDVVAPGLCMVLRICTLSNTNKYCIKQSLACQYHHRFSFSPSLHSAFTFVHLPPMQFATFLYIYKILFYSQPQHNLKFKCKRFLHSGLAILSIDLFVNLIPNTQRTL